MSRRSTIALVGVLIAALSACTGTSGGAPAGGDQAKPGQVVTAPGTGQQAVELDADAARRIGLTTGSVGMRSPAPGQPPQPVAPLSAILYDKDGRTWVYVSEPTRMYVRTAVVLGPVVGADMVVLQSGPAPGTSVVTQGSVELLGVEQGVGGEK